MSSSDVARALVDRHGQTYASEAGITVGNTPAPLHQLLVLTTLLSARISAELAVGGARALFHAGWRTPQKLRDSTWQQRVDALDEGGYSRYDERTATHLGDIAALVLERWHGDLRRLRAEGEGVDGVRKLLQDFPGIGPTGADIFCREVQGVWGELAPFVDHRVQDGASALGLPTEPGKLVALVPAGDLVALVSGCVRASLSTDVVADVLGR